MSLQRELADSLFKAENEVYKSLIRPGFAVKGEGWYIEMHPRTWEALRVEADSASVVYADREGVHPPRSMVGWDSFLGVPVRFMRRDVAEGLVKLRFETTLLGGE